MSREAFHELLTRYLEGKCSQEEKELVEEWYNTLENNSSISDINQFDHHEIEERLWGNISSKYKRKSSRYLQYAAAACLLVFSAVGLLFWYGQDKTPTFVLELSKSTLQKHENKTLDIIDFMLEDGSYIKLYPNSSLFYPENFASDNRKVFLSGEAFFDIIKDESKPFLVVNHHNIVHVVGTSFLVRSFSEIEKTEVNVVSGKVWVEEIKNSEFKKNVKLESEKIILTANQKLSFNTRNHRLEASIIDRPLIIKKESKLMPSLEFNEVALREVLPLLEELYGIDIKISSQNLENCTFTGDLKAEDLFQKLDLICQSIGATYSIESTHVNIIGDGCPI